MKLPVETTVVMLELTAEQLKSLSNQVQVNQSVDPFAEKTKALADKKIHREQKIFRLPTELLSDMRRVQFRLSEVQNRRVTETEIVEMALRVFINTESGITQ